MTGMENTDPAVDINSRSTRLVARAAETRRRALSPIRILVMVLALPLTIGAIAASVYLRVSEFDRPGTVVHLVAIAGCEVTDRMGFGPFRRGEPGYHVSNDPDGNGVACDSAARVQPTSTSLRQAEPRKERRVGNAKFVRP